MSAAKKIIDITDLAWGTQSAIEKIIELETNSKKEIEKYKALALENFRILDYKPYKYYTNEFRYKTKSDWKPSETRQLARGMYQEEILLTEEAQFVAWFEEDKKIREENKLIEENNKKIYNNLLNLIKLIGIETRHKDPKSRKRIPDWVDKDFVAELYNSCKTSDGSWRLVEQGYTNWITRCKEIVVKKEKELQEKQKAEAEVKKIKDKEVLILDLVKKYSLDTSKGIPEPDDILDQLLSKDKYLRLAHFLALNRGDWNDGPSYAKQGLNSFAITTELDGKIANELWSYINNWDGDGRIFRDCTYNYTFIFGLVESQDLYNDYQKIKEYVSY
jgi:hypothetical protein